MITENYVSFETAKLLNAKGFKGEFHKHYWGYEPRKEFLTDGSFNPEYDYPAPTLQIVMKWLEDVHHILVVADYVYECTDTSWVYKIYRLDENGKPERCAIRGTRYDKRMDTYVDEIVGYRDYDMSYKDYETRAEAEEEGIKSVLENL